MDARVARCLSAALALVGAARSAAGAEGPRPKYSPTERLAPARLRATHEDALRVQRSRQVVPPVPGLNDYRAILHAHAEDSAHTGGTLPEMLAAAQRAEVRAVLLSNHYRPPRDFMADGWRGVRDGVLFLPGSEDRGFLLYPLRSVVGHMKDPKPAFVEAVRADGGLIFLSHVEERPDHPTAGLDGMEIYNRHADAKKDAAGVRAIFLKLTDPATLRELEEGLRQFPDEVLAAQVSYPADYLAKGDAATTTQRLTGVAANDCHHNQVLLVKMVDADTVKVGTNVDPDDRMTSVPASLRPGIRALTAGHRPGDVLARLDFDPYDRAFRNVSTHVLAPELTEAAVRSALRDGRAYVSHDWACDPSGFRFELLASPAAVAPKALMGDEAAFAPGLALVARFPVACRARLLCGGRVVAEQTGDRLEHPVSAPGAYRVEGWLTLDGEERPWVYSNPIYVR